MGQMSGKGPVCRPHWVLGPSTAPSLPHVPGLSLSTALPAPHAPMLGPRHLALPLPAPSVLGLGPGTAFVHPCVLGSGALSNTEARASRGSGNKEIGEWCHCSPFAKFMDLLGALQAR